ncbi:hypothetical protein K3148_03800 [Qipengyuania aurantiaca]|uniref:Uncharacterized protein n=1 Tax=Qipengyuania aurantiaca TaxID=2867233 RepID=A0ABX8ZP74_9SPHN|nr:DUF6544 family protein [Qipengyuania aurantiaca]QZD90526.1 hypothetical protein K3148_03800 [Qipengyuania aurantiaca]
MKRRTIMWFVGAGALVAIGGGIYAWSTSLSRAFNARRADAAAEPMAKMPVLTEEDIAPLPEPVRHYIGLTGSIGRPIVTEIVMHFDAAMFDAPGEPGMTGPVVQYERFDVPHRLFFMNTKMKGLPVAVLHDFNRDQATMRVRLAGLANVVNISGPELTRTETVTILNDIAFYAPSRLTDPRLEWTAIDDARAKVDFTLGSNTVSAELIFNEAGELVDFVSDDRGMLEKDGSLTIARWTTPLGNYREFDGWRLASEGVAIWHLPEGPFTYGHLRLTHYEAR